MRPGAEDNRGRIRGVGRESTGWGEHYGRKPVRRDSAREAFNRHPVYLAGCSACGEHQCSQSSPDGPVVGSVWQLLREPVERIDRWCCGMRRLRSSLGGSLQFGVMRGGSAIDMASNCRRDKERPGLEALRWVRMRTISVWLVNVNTPGP
jgi:hypothetical protein